MIPHPASPNNPDFLSYGIVSSNKAITVYIITKINSNCPFLQALRISLGGFTPKPSLINRWSLLDQNKQTYLCFSSYFLGKKGDKEEEKKCAWASDKRSWSKEEQCSLFHEICHMLCGFITQILYVLVWWFDQLLTSFHTAANSWLGWLDLSCNPNSRITFCSFSVILVTKKKKNEKESSLR